MRNGAGKWHIHREAIVTYFREMFELGHNVSTSELVAL